LFQWGTVFLPLVELYRTFFGNKIEILFFSIEEIAVLLWVGTLFAAGVFFAAREHRKKALFLTGTVLAVLFVFLILHAYNASCFDKSVLPGADPSFVRECYYTVRMYLAPICLVLSVFLLRIPFDRIKRGILGAGLVIALAILLTDLFGTSFASYADGNVVVKGGFFSWFTLSEDADFALYTAKGPFHSANDMSAVLFAITPFAAFSCLKRGKLCDWLLLMALGLACVMVGTKISSLGFVAALLATVAVFVLSALRTKTEKNVRKKLLFSLLILFVYLPLFLISPGKRLQDNRNREAENVYRPTENVGQISEVTEKDDSADLTEEDAKTLAVYLENNHWDHFIDAWFLELYPVSYDPEFWETVVVRPNIQNSDTRVFKTELVGRITEQNGRSLDRLFGIGFTSGVPYVERDYVNQYYLFGIVGLLVLIVPFFVLFFGGAAKAFCSFWKGRPFFTQGATLVSLFALFGTAYYAGHVFDTIFPTYFLCVVSAALVSLRQRDEE